MIVPPPLHITFSCSEGNFAHSSRPGPRTLGAWALSNATEGFSCSLITKLRSILLMEANFNGANKTVFGIRMQENVWRHSMMLEKVFSEQNRMVDDGMLTKEMNFFLWTGFGDSMDFATSSLEIKTQGLSQGNGTGPAGWVVTSICIIMAHKEKGHVTHFLCPITKLRSHIKGVIYLIHLIHFCMDKSEDALDTFYGIHEAFINWTKLLLAFG
ncbi:hypothetical protein ACHAXA_002921, partial [Cyclostephanos tholiformis]